MMTIIVIMELLVSEVRTQTNNTMIGDPLDQCQKLNTTLIMMTLGITVGLSVTILSTLITVAFILIRNSRRRTYHIPQVSVRKHANNESQIHNLRINEYENDMF